MEVFGVEAYLFASPNSISAKVPARIYFCKLDNNGNPDFDFADSIDVSLPKPLSNNPTLWGGNFTNTLTGTPTSYTVTGDYAVLVKNLSGVYGDVVCALRTGSKTYTNTSAMISEKYSDGYGLVSFNQQFYKTTNFNLWPGFGVGTDYEFLVAPRVKYKLKASHAVPAEASVTNTICTRTALTFTNTSSPFYTHRQYNLCEFYQYWKNIGSLVVAPGTGWPADFPISWFFEYDDNAQPLRDPRKPLLQGQSTVTSETDLPGCYTSNSFRARLRKMEPSGDGFTYFYNEDFSVCLEYCNGDAVGLNKNFEDSELLLYPNPAAKGFVTISGLKGNALVFVKDISGRIIKTAELSADQHVLNLDGMANGTYFIHIKSDANNERVMKLILQPTGH